MLKRVIRKNRNDKVYAFIDNQNLNLGVQRIGWKMDWRKLREYLRSEHQVSQAYMFIGYMQEHEDLYKQMYDAGYNVILKPTVGMFNDEDDNNHADKQTKGNVDADLVLEAMKQWPKYNQAIIISGDGDFFGLIEYLESKNKLKHIMVPNWKYSSLLKPYEKYIVRVDKLRSQLAYRDSRKQTKSGRKKQQSSLKNKKK